MGENKEQKTESERTVLCGANSYEEKYWFNPAFSNIPKAVQDELKIMMVLYTEECGGSLFLEYAPDGTLLFRTEVADADYLYDEIEAGLRLRKLSEEKKELFESLELYYRVFVLQEAGALKNEDGK